MVTGHDPQDAEHPRTQESALTRPGEDAGRPGAPPEAAPAEEDVRFCHRCGEPVPRDVDAQVAHRRTCPARMR